MPQNGQDESPPAAPNVHALHHGMALCGLAGLPVEWPEGQTWVAAAYIDKLEEITCDTCRAEYHTFFPRSNVK